MVRGHEILGKCRVRVDLLFRDRHTDRNAGPCNLSPDPPSRDGLPLILGWGELVFLSRLYLSGCTIRLYLRCRAWLKNEKGFVLFAVNFRLSAVAF